MHQTNPVAVVEMLGDAWGLSQANLMMSKKTFLVAGISQVHFLLYTVIIPSLLRKLLSLVIGFWQGCLSISRHSRPLKIQSDFESGVERSPASPYFYVLP